MAVEQLLKKHFWVLGLGVVAATAFFHAQGVGAILGSKIGANDEQLSAPPLGQGPPPAADTGARRTSAAAILTRNPFDSVTGSLIKSAASTTSESAPTETTDSNDDPWTAPPCDGVRVLIIAASTDPEWSLAIFAGTDGKTTMRRRGSTFGDKTVEFVGWDRVWLKSGGSRCQATVFKAAGAPSVAAPPPPPPTTPAKPGPAGGGAAPPVPEDIKKGIVKVSPTEFNVDRGVLDKVLQNQADLMKQARIVPEMDAKGGNNGIRLFGVRPDTLLGVLGMQNGDRIEKINGFDLTSPEKALEAYARLRTADKITVQVTRNGQPQNIDYNVK